MALLSLTLRKFHINTVFTLCARQSYTCSVLLEPLGSIYRSSANDRSYRKEIAGCQPGGHRPLRILTTYGSPFLTSWRGYAKKYKDKSKKESSAKKGQDKPSVELSSDELNEVIDFNKMVQQMEMTLQHLKKEYAEQLALRTSMSMFDGLTVDTPDGQFPLIQIAQVVQKSPQLMLINLAAAPQYIVHVKAAIASSGLNVNPQQDGTSLFVPVPRVTREHREALAKNAKTLCDKTKEKLRHIQNNYDREVKKAKENHSEDLVFHLHETVLSTAKNFIEKADAVMLAKQQELLDS